MTEQQESSQETKRKKPTPTQLKAELEALKEVATARMTRIRDTEILLQKIRTAIKSDGRPGMSLSQDHFRLKTQLDEVRNLLGVTGEADV